MRDMRRLLMPLCTLLLVILAAAIFVRAGRGDSSMWTVQTSGIDTNLRGVSIGTFADSHGVGTVVVWASGSNGVILQSKDAGKTWKRLHVQGGEALDFRSIQARDATTAYVMSSGESDKSRIYKTTDGGASWKLQYTDKRKGFFLDALVCDSEMECLAVGDPIDGKFVILRTATAKPGSSCPPIRCPMRCAMKALLPRAERASRFTAIEHDYFVTGGPAARVYSFVRCGLQLDGAATRRSSVAMLLPGSFPSRLGIKRW